MELTEKDKKTLHILKKIGEPEGQISILGVLLLVLGAGVYYIFVGIRNWPDGQYLWMLWDGLGLVTLGTCLAVTVRFISSVKRLVDKLAPAGDEEGAAT